MHLVTSAFENLGAIHEEFAFCAVDAATHTRLSANRNPDFSWTGLPRETQSLVLLCHDPDVPSRGDDVNKEGRTVPATLPRVDFFHWVLIDLAPDTPAIARGEFSDGVIARGKTGPQAPRGARQGVNDYTGWFAGDESMAGNYFGYDGPCPPWNDELPHRYTFSLFALDVSRLETVGIFGGADVRRAMSGHVLGNASVTGRYALNPSIRL